MCKITVYVNGTNAGGPYIAQVTLGVSNILNIGNSVFCFNSDMFVSFP